MLTNLIVVVTHNIDIYQIITLNTLNLQNVTCQLYLKEAGGGGRTTHTHMHCSNINTDLLLLILYYSYVSCNHWRKLGEDTQDLSVLSLQVSILSFARTVAIAF